MSPGGLCGRRTTGCTAKTSLTAETSTASAFSVTAHSSPSPCHWPLRSGRQRPAVPPAWWCSPPASGGGRTVLPPSLDPQLRGGPWWFCLAADGRVAMTNRRFNQPAHRLRLHPDGRRRDPYRAATWPPWPSAPARAVSRPTRWPWRGAVVLYLCRLWLAAMALCLALPFLCREPAYVWRQDRPYWLCAGG